MTAIPYRARRRVGRLLFYLLLAAILVYTVFPFYWAVVTSLKTGTALFAPDLLPEAPDLDNYLAVFREQPFARNIANSAIVAGTVTLLSLFLGVTAAFALGRIRFAGRRPTMLVILGVSMFPQIALLSGLFQLVRWLGLYNSLIALITEEVEDEVEDDE